MFLHYENCSTSFKVTQLKEIKLTILLIKKKGYKIYIKILLILNCNVKIA